MSTDLMIDLESLDATPQCAILTIGLVLFDPYGQGVAEKITLRPTLEDQVEKYGRVVCDATVEWWSKQSPEAQEEALSDHDRVPFRECMETLYKYAWNRKAVWSHGSAFDVIICENAFRSVLTDYPNPVPWQFWTIRDTRTLYEVAGVNLRDGGKVVSHRAVDDAERQALLVQESYRKLGMVKR